MGLTFKGKACLFLMKASLWKYDWYKKFFENLFFYKIKQKYKD